MNNKEYNANSEIAPMVLYSLWAIFSNSEYCLRDMLRIRQLSC